jgi:hypothetical protein
MTSPYWRTTTQPAEPSENGNFHQFEQLIEDEIPIWIPLPAMTVHAYSNPPLQPDKSS